MESVRTPFVSGIFRVKWESVLWHPTCYCWLEKRQAGVNEGPDLQSVWSRYRNQKYEIKVRRVLAGHLLCSRLEDTLKFKLFGLGCVGGRTHNWWYSDVTSTPSSVLKDCSQKYLRDHLYHPGLLYARQYSAPWLPMQGFRCSFEWVTFSSCLGPRDMSISICPWYTVQPAGW